MHNIMGKLILQLMCDLSLWILNGLWGNYHSFKIIHKKNDSLHTVGSYLEFPITLYTVGPLPHMQSIEADDKDSEIQYVA